MLNTYLDIIQNYYPNANYSEVLGKELIIYLAEQGYEPGQVMLANSICSDDINAMQFPHSAKGLLGPFNLGGLNGFPFTGLTGVQAFAHHMPDDGGLLIFYAPHIGITIHDHPLGKPGYVRRIGQHHDSTCCGAAMAAIEKIKEGPYTGITELDYQEDTIVRLFYNHKEKILNARYPIMAATDVMYKAIEERINLLIERSYKEFSGKYLLLVGGIFINVDETESGNEVAKSCVAYSNIETINLHTKERKNHLPQFTGWFSKKMSR